MYVILYIALWTNMGGQSITGGFHDVFCSFFDINVIIMSNIDIIIHYPSFLIKNHILDPICQVEA